MVNEKSYINIQAFMVNDLHLKGNELLIYAIIWGFSQDGVSEFTGGLQYLADWTNSTQQGVLKALKKLLEKQLLLKNEKRNGIIKYCTYKVSQYETKFNGESRLNKVESPIKQSLITDETKFNGTIKQSLSNTITNTLDDKLNDNKEYSAESNPDKNQPKKKNGISEDDIKSICEADNLTGKSGSIEGFINWFKSASYIENGILYYNNSKINNYGGLRALLRRVSNNGKAYNTTSQNGGYVNNRRPASDSNTNVDF